jgi:hypothetical protein
LKMRIEKESTSCCGVNLAARGDVLNLVAGRRGGLSGAVILAAEIRM